jgi:hypothetical protein
MQSGLEAARSAAAKATAERLQVAEGLTDAGGATHEARHVPTG